MSKKSIKGHTSGGFSLIEIAIVMTIISLLIIPALKLYQTYVDRSKAGANQQRIIAIQQGLTNFATRYGKLPCPASFIAQSSDENYGREIVPLCLDKNKKIYTPDGKATFAANGRTAPGQNPAIIIGTVPTRDLGLSDSMRADMSGHLFTYAVTATHTQSMAGDGVINVVDENGRTVLPYASDKGTGTASYVLVGHGKDGKGAYMAGPTAAIVPPIPCDSAPGLDTLNCSFEIAPAPSPFAFRAAPYGTQRGPNWFDDIIVYHAPISAMTNNVPLPASIAIMPSVKPAPGNAAPASIPACTDGEATGACLQQLNDAMQKGEQIDEKQFNSIMQGQMKTLMQQSKDMEDIRKELDQYGQ